jgi:hypothetical protein
MTKRQNTLPHQGTKLDRSPLIDDDVRSRRLTGLTRMTMSSGGLSANVSDRDRLCRKCRARSLPLRSPIMYTKNISLDLATR